MEWYLKVLKEYATFSGRARRKEYWMFTLISFLISIAIMIIDQTLGLTFGGTAYSQGSGIIGTLYSLFVLIPSLAVLVRRLHDTSRSGWWVLIGLIPLVGAILLIVWAATEGDKGKNEYGADPKNGVASNDDLIDDMLID